MQFPRAEEGRPINDAAQIGQIPIFKNMQAWLFGRRRLVAHIGHKGIGAGILQAQEDARFLTCPHIADVLIIGCRRPNSQACMFLKIGI